MLSNIGGPPASALHSDIFRATKCHRRAAEPHSKRDRQAGRDWPVYAAYRSIFGSRPGRAGSDHWWYGLSPAIRTSTARLRGPRLRQTLSRSPVLIRSDYPPAPSVQRLDVQADCFRMPSSKPHQERHKPVVLSYSAASTSLYKYFEPSTPSHGPSSYSSANVPSNPAAIIIFTDRFTSLSFQRFQYLA